MKKITLIFQEILKFCLMFLLAFVWCRYLIRRKLWLAVFVAFMIACVVYLIMFVLNRKKLNTKGLKLQEKEKAENMFLSLCCQDKPMDFFYKLALKKHQNIIKHKNYITIKHQQENVSTVLWFENSFAGLSIARFMDIYLAVKKEKATKIVVCCKEISDKNLISFSQNFDEKFMFLDVYQTYEKLFKFYDFYPEITRKYKTEKKIVFNDLIAHSFNKNRTKGYLFSALILILSSVFIRTTLYYCIVASMLVIFAIVSQFNPYFNTKKETEVL